MERKRPLKSNAIVKHPSSIKLSSTVTTMENQNELNERKYATMSYETSLISVENLMEKSSEIRKNIAASLYDVSKKCLNLQGVNTDTILKR